MNHDDEFFQRAIAHWRERDGRYVPVGLIDLAVAQARRERSRAACEMLGGLVGRRRKRRAAHPAATAMIRHA